MTVIAKKILRRIRSAARKAALAAMIATHERVLDVSEFQPEQIDWAKVKKAGYSVILRMGLRGSLAGNPARYRKICFDAHYKAYLEGVLKAGIRCSVYYFPTPLTDLEADQEADWIIANLGGTVPDMPVFLDVEYVLSKSGERGCADFLTREQRTRFLKRITDRLVAAGIPCGIYASVSWLRNKIDLSRLQDQVVDNTWVTQFEPLCTYDGRYALWQYTCNGKVDGISGRVDISMIRRKFNMSCRKKARDGSLLK